MASIPPSAKVAINYDIKSLPPSLPSPLLPSLHLPSLSSPHPPSLPPSLPSPLLPSLHPPSLSSPHPPSLPSPLPPSLPSLHPLPLPPSLPSPHPPSLPSLIHQVSNHSMPPHLSPPPKKGTPHTTPPHTVLIFNGSKMVSPTVVPITADLELQAILKENKLLVVVGGHSVVDLGSSVCIPVPPHCSLISTRGTLAFEDCGGSGQSTIAQGLDEVMVFDGVDVRWAWSEGEAVHGAVMVHVTPHWVLVSQSDTFSGVVCDTLELMRKGVVFEFSLDDRGRLVLWSRGMMPVQLEDVEVIDSQGMGGGERGVGGGVPTLPKLLYSFNGTHLTECSEHDLLLTGTDSYVYVTKTSVLRSNDPILNNEMGAWLSSLHPQFEIRSSDEERSMLYVGEVRVIELSSVHAISTLITEQLRYCNETLVLEATGTQTTTSTQTTTVSVPSVSRLMVLTYGGVVPVLFEKSAPMTTRGGGQLYLGNQGAFYCVNKDINAAIGHHLVAKVVAAATSLSLFSITLSDSGSMEGTSVRLSFNGTHVLNLRGSAMTMLLPSSMITYQDGTLSVQKEGLAVQTHRGVVSFLLFDGLQLLNYSGSGPSAIVPGGSLYMDDSGTAFYAESSLLVAQIASILDFRNGGSDYSLTPRKTCRCLELNIKPTLTAPTDTPLQAASLFPDGHGQGSVAMGYDNAVDATHTSCDSTRKSCDSTCVCTCNLQQLSSIQEHKGLNGEQETPVPLVAPSAIVDGTASLHTTPRVTMETGQVTAGSRSPRGTTDDVMPVTWITPLEGAVQFELAVAGGELILYLNDTELLALTRARRVSVPPDCSVGSDGFSLQVISPQGAILQWYRNVASLVVFEDMPPPPGGPSSILPLPGGGQLFVDADRAFYSLSDPLTARLELQASLPSFSSAPLLPSLSSTPFLYFQYTITSAGFLVSLLARGHGEILTLDDLDVIEVEERPTLTIGGDGLVLVEGNSTSSFPNVKSLSVTDGVNLWSYTDIQLSVEPGLLMVWGRGALYSSGSALNEHLLQLVFSAQVSQSCISTIAMVQEGVVSVLLHGNPVAEIKPENGDVCLSLAANHGFSLVNSSVVTTSDGLVFRDVRSLKTLANCTLRTVYQSDATFVGPGELCVTTAGGIFFFVLPSLSALHGAYLHVVARFQAPSLAAPSSPSTFVATSGTVVSIGQSVSIFAGLHLTLLCSVTRGNPPPNVLWSLNGDPLGNGDKHAVDGVRGTMTIFGVDQSDAGEYKCTAANIRGSAQAQSALTVLAADVSCMYADSYSLCSAACGVGVQQRAVLCQRVFNGTIFPVDPHSLPISQRPAPSIRLCLSNQMCPAQSYVFHVGEYGPCSASCHGGRQSRSVSCMELYSGTPVRGVESFVCTLAGLEAPPTHRLCNMGACPFWLGSAYGNCSARCGNGVKTRTVKCLTSLEDAILNDTACNSGTKPAISEPCTGTDCEYQWSASEWDKCAAGCMQTRAVVCVEASSRIEVDTTYCQRLHDPPFSQQSCDNGDCTHAK